MENYVFYQTNKSVWFVPLVDWNEFIFETEKKIIRMTILEVTDEWAFELYELFRRDKPEFIETIKEELNNSLNTLYMN